MTMLFATTWEDLEMITISEASQTEKDKYMISLICGIQKVNTWKLVYKTETGP